MRVEEKNNGYNNVTDEPSKTQFESAVSDLSSVALKRIPEPSSSCGTAMKVQFGRLIAPQQQVLLYSSDEWEEFIREWVHSQVSIYISVLRFAGANDMGIDIAGLTDDKGLHGVWDNFQCKHYDNPLTPGTASAEVAKILWHSFEKHYAPPRKYYFISPRGCGKSLMLLLTNTTLLQKHVVENWENQCANAITKKQSITLDGAFKRYVETFDFSIFATRSMLEVIDDHRVTPYYAVRFGGGLPDRPAVLPPPSEVDVKESRYVQQLFEAYSDYAKIEVTNLAGLDLLPDIIEHFHRQREFFYHAEALRNFARDTVPSGTFEDLQSEVHAGVVDIEVAQHQDGYARMNAVTQTATQLQLTSNALISVVKIQDRKGICHQLANDDRLHWRKS